MYLWGAGATQAEITYLGAHSVNLLMRDNEHLGEGVATRILRKLPKRWQSAFAADEGTDIEKLISLLTASGIASHSKLADTIRQLYFDDICASLATAKVLDNPQLAVGLFDMHNNKYFAQHSEVLAGIITTNHDGLLQLAAHTVQKEVNLGIPFQSTDVTLASTQRPQILQLHGSFTWRFEIPTSVSLLTAASTYSADTVWIPPAILKESKSYPFNRLAALAYELLSKYCDVLRVVGSALTQNDWHILSLIFNAQRHREITKGSAFRIELITRHGTGIAITRECSYLRYLTPIGHLTDGDFSEYKEDESTHSAEMKNALAYWLKKKIRFHQRQGEFGPPPLASSIVHIAGDSV